MTNWQNILAPSPMATVDVLRKALTDIATKNYTIQEMKALAREALQKADRPCL